MPMRNSLLIFFFWSVISCFSMAYADPVNPFLQLLNSVQNVASGQGIESTENTNDGQSAGDQPSLSAVDFYISDVDPSVQSHCHGCHQLGGVAANSGALLLFTKSPTENENVMSEYVAGDNGDADKVLSKIQGDLGHGGGQVFTTGSPQFQAFEQYFNLLLGEKSEVPDIGYKFWAGLINEDRGTTLRRASLLIAGQVAKDAQVERDA